MSAWGRPGEPFADALRAVRRAAGLSQVQLAARSGVAERTISNLERGVSLWPQAETLRMLVETLGANPADGERLRAAAAQVRRGAPAATLSGRAAAEARHPLLGREAELARLAELGRGGRVVTVSGPGGSGKSRLALEFAARAAGRGTPVHLVALDSLSTADGVLPAVAQALGAPPELASPRVVAGFLEDGALLLLDDADRMHDAAAQIAALAAAAPTATVLVTSREPLGVPGERVVPVGPLPVPEPEAAGDPGDGAGEIRLNPAVELFLSRAAEAGRPVDAEGLAAVAGIVRALDGLPLAIELAAAQAPFLPAPAILDLLTRTGGALLARPGGADDRQRTMTGAIGWSAELLPADARALLPVLGAFRGGFSSAALAETLAGIGEPALLGGLPALLRASLVHLVEGADRFAMLEPIRFFAAGLLEEHPRRDEIRRAHARTFAAWARRIGDAVRGPELGAALQAEALDRPNALAAAQWATARGEIELAAGIVEPLAWVLESRSLIVLLRELVDPIADRVDAIADPELRRRMRLRAVIVARMFGSPEAMSRRQEQLRASGEGDPLARAMAMHMEALLRLPGSRDPVDLLVELRPVYEAASHPYLHYCDVMLGLELGRAGRTAEGLEVLRATLARLERTGDLIDRPTTFEHMALLLNDAGQYAESRELLRRSMALCREHRLDELLQDAISAYSEAAGRDDDPALMLLGATLKGAMRAYAERIGVPMMPWRLERNAVTRRHIVGRLGEEAFEEALARGRALSLQQAADLAMAPLPAAVS